MVVAEACKEFQIAGDAALAKTVQRPPVERRNLKADRGGRRFLVPRAGTALREKNRCANEKTEAIVKGEVFACSKPKTSERPGCGSGGNLPLQAPPASFVVFKPAEVHSWRSHETALRVAPGITYTVRPTERKARKIRCSITPEESLRGGISGKNP